MSLTSRVLDRISVVCYTTAVMEISGSAVSLVDTAGIRIMRTRGRMGYVKTERHYKLQGKAQDSAFTEDKIMVKTFETEPARVRSGYKQTVNLGNYENVTVSCEVELPCYVAEINAALEEADRVATETINKMLDEVR